MPITILDYVKSQIGEKDSYSAEDFYSVGVDIIGGCELCAATLAAYNAYPAKSGYWRCADCIGSSGFTTAEQFSNFDTEAAEEFTNSETSRAVSWLLRLRQLQRSGMDFDTALAQANAEAELGPDSELMVCDGKLADLSDLAQPSDPDLTQHQTGHADDDTRLRLLNCPACGAAEHLTEIWENVFKCGDCGSAWRL